MITREAEMEIPLSQGLNDSCDDKFLETLPYMHGDGVNSWQSENNIMVFNDKVGPEKEGTPDKLIIKSHLYNASDFNQLPSDKDSSCSSYECLVPTKSIEKVQDILQKKGISEYASLSKKSYAHSKSLTSSPRTDLWQESGMESNLIHVLKRQIQSLALKEQEVEQTLSKERIENLVSKVEEEVEFEGMFEDLCMRFKTEGEFMAIERRERDWERERREVRLEEEVELLRNRVELLQEEIKIAHEERDRAICGQIERHALVDFCQLSPGSNVHSLSRTHDTDNQVDDKVFSLTDGCDGELFSKGGNPSRILRETPCQAEENAKRDHKLLEDTFREEQQHWIEREQLLKNQICGLEEEVSSMRATLEEKDSIISSEMERRKQYGLEVDKVTALRREGNMVHCSVIHRLNVVEGLLSKIADKLKYLETLNFDGESEAAALVSEMLSDLDAVGPCGQTWLVQDELQDTLLGKEQLLEKPSEECLACFDSKEEELYATSYVEKRLIDSLASCKTHLCNLKRQLEVYRTGSVDDSDLEGSSVSEGKPQDAVKGADACCGYGQGLINDIFKEIGHLSRELRKEQDKRDKYRADMSLLTQELKDERDEWKAKVSNTHCLMEDLRKQIKTKEIQIEQEQKQMDLLLESKDAETDHLKTLLKSKDVESERVLQKFKEELELMQEEVQKERRERENVMDTHFSSRRKLIQEMKEKEARWQKDIEEMVQEMEQLRREIDEKNQIISNLSKDLRRFELNINENIIREDGRNSLIRISEDVSNVFTDSAKNDSAFIKSATSGNCDRKDAEWQQLIGKISGFDKQIAEAMLAIQSLKEELNVKEKELQRARLERDSERKAVWIHDQVQANDVENSNDILRRDDEDQLAPRDNEDLIKLLQVERADTADAISILQGAVRELQWALKHYIGKQDFSSFELNRGPQSFSLKGELVKVHASHLEELDAYILELKLKVEEAEKRARTAEVALAVNAAKNSARGTVSTSSFTKIGKEWVGNSQLRQGEPCSAPGTVRWVGGAHGYQTHHSARRQSKIRGDVLHGSDFKDSRQDRTWSGDTLGNSQVWDLHAGSAGLDTASNNNSSGWMTLRSATDDSLIMQDSFQQPSLTLAVSTPPPRSQRRWVVDALWLENVRTSIFEASTRYRKATGLCS
ncbi:hypothetical protein KP509_14G087000 [Ceratopteris richardii]|uniref:Uncharacterized protein n=1 Tax=Ceratopteris richardii TaxID=49495 RepID=A0A8T2TBQ4_CERRI|nr:hypothetical protein KP509_14G087000 [Ceratopteris richardii]